MSGGASGPLGDSEAGTAATSSQRPQYASLETGTRTDAAEGENQANPNSQYAMTTVHDETPMETGNSRVDKTTKELTAILVRIVDNLETWPGLTPQAYGRLVHEEFADEVRAAVLPGIGYDDVETTWPEGWSYGSPDSFRTDVILRDDNGAVISIYDVKTGQSGLTPARIAELLAKIGASSATRVIELRVEGAIIKTIQVMLVSVGIE